MFRERDRLDALQTSMSFDNFETALLGDPFAAAFIACVIAAILAFDVGRRWWRQNEWKRRWQDRRPDD